MKEQVILALSGFECTLRARMNFHSGQKPAIFLYQPPRNKMGSFREATGTKKTLFLTMITTYGLANSPHKGMAQNELDMGVLFGGEFSREIRNLQ